ncbi:MAG TPA: DUF4288 domain-containing protein [Chryseolinea sp.]|nr:DUF4288 domain-containing protein [Chryseolinea sp.]HPH45958.1 DUF4288 domain-containing protein [Chryseolinea sp.]HPM30621.1 DUF4288 domain-containing protein [Chryseolinea sp.]
MNWYISKIVFSIENTQASKSQFDEQLRLVAANSTEEAFMKARTIGLNEEEIFYNSKQNEVKWEFINVSEIIPLNKLENGIELYSRIHETEEARTYINFIHQKAIAIRLNECNY